MARGSETPSHLLVETHHKCGGKSGVSGSEKGQEGERDLENC